MNTNTEICVPCELPFAAQNQTKVETESCPVCFTEEGLRKLNGCGHSICGDCDARLKTTPGQFTETLGLSVKYIKCPLCRQTEKKTYEQLEAEVAYYRSRPHPQQITILRPQIVFNVNEPAIVASQVAVIRALRTRLTQLGELNRLTDIPERESIVTELSYIQRNWTYAVRAYDNEVLRNRNTGVDRDTAIRFALAGMAVPQTERRVARTTRTRWRCTTEGCTTPAPTQRRCPNHANVACCRRCDTCYMCP